MPRLHYFWIREHRAQGAEDWDQKQKTDEDDQSHQSGEIDGRTEGYIRGIASYLVLRMETRYPEGLLALVALFGRPFPLSWL